MSAGDFIRDILRTRLHACGLVVGENHQFGKNRTGDKEYLSRYKAENVFFVTTVSLKTEGTVTISSSSMRELLAQGKVREMAEKMGHPYLIRVQRERGIGKASQMGYPTLNFRRPDPPKAVPPAGVYAAGLDAGDTQTPGALYIGDCPTFEGRDAHLEFYVLHTGDALPEIGEDEWAHIWVREFIRAEKAFESEEELKARIRKDVSLIATFFKEEKEYDHHHGEETGAGSPDGDQ
jgi:riboflavin kinase/FMN adenylyltransferase